MTALLGVQAVDQTADRRPHRRGEIRHDAGNAEHAIMGGWIALHLALLRPERVHSLAGIAAAPDFTDWGFPEHLKERLAAGETLRRESPYGGEQVTTAGFWSSGQKLLLLAGEIGIDCPIRLVHGEADPDVPLDIAFRTMIVGCTSSILAASFSRLSA